MSPEKGHVFVCIQCGLGSEPDYCVFPSAMDPGLALLSSPAFVSRTCSPSAVNTVYLVCCICVTARLLLNAIIWCFLNYGCIHTLFMHYI